MMMESSKVAKVHKRYDRNEIFEFIKSYKVAHGGLTPTIRDIMDKFGISSTSVVTFHLDALVRSGRLKRGVRGFIIPGEEYRA